MRASRTWGKGIVPETLALMMNHLFLRLGHALLKINFSFQIQNIMQRQPTKKSISRQRSSSRKSSQNESIHEKNLENKSEEELKEFVTSLQFKILKKNDQLTKLKEQNIELQVQWQEDKRNWQNEKC